MLQEVKELQNRAVKELLQVVGHKKEKEITFKAPTGSGKTFMMAKFFNEILTKQDDIIFLVNTLSKCELAKQSYEKFCEYKKKYFSKLEPFLINSNNKGQEDRFFIPEDKNVYVLPKDLLGKRKTISEQNVLKVFLEQQTNCNFFSKKKKKKVYLIKAAVLPLD